MPEQNEGPELSAVAVEIAALRLVVGALIGHLLVDDPAEAGDALDELLRRVDRLASTAVRSETEPETAAAFKRAARASALALVDNLRPRRAARDA